MYTLHLIHMVLQDIMLLQVMFVLRLLDQLCLTVMHYPLFREVMFLLLECIFLLLERMFLLTECLMWHVMR